MRPTLRVSLKGGRADQHRAPVKDLVLLLGQMQGLVLDLGMQFFGADHPDTHIEESCRLEVVGLSLMSVTLELELAFDTEAQPNRIGRRAIEMACGAFSALRDPHAYPDTLPVLGAAERVEAMGDLLDRGYARVEATYVADGREVTGVLDHELRARLVADQAGALTVEGVTIRGVLYGLEDRPSEAREKKLFNGDFLDEVGEPWAVRFKQEQADLARGLWKKSVQLTGTARYSKTRRPVLYVESGQIVEGKSWEQVLLRYRGAWKDLYQGMSFEQIMRDLR